MGSCFSPLSSDRWLVVLKLLEFKNVVDIKLRLRMLLYEIEVFAIDWKEHLDGKVLLGSLSNCWLGC